MRASVVALLVAFASPAGATLLLYEPFDYAPGVLAGRAASGVNLTGAYAGNVVPAGHEVQVVSPGSGYGKLVGAPKPRGNRATQNLGNPYATAKVRLANPLVVAPGDTLFFSALVTLDDSVHGNHLASLRFEDDTNFDEISFGEPTVGRRAVRISATTLGTGGLVRSTGANDAFANGDTLLLVGRYENAAAPGGDVLELIGYDTADADRLPQRFDPADPNAEFAFRRDGLDVNLARVTSIRFQLRGAGNNFVDEFRAGTSYADVVPEPGTAALLGSGLAALALRSRRRRHTGAAATTSDWWPLF
jgi:hypothetical protein